jgi:hypothetical protein
MSEKTEAPRACFCAGAGPHLTELAAECLPASAREHFRASRIEFLKGIRTLIDERISSLSRETAKGASIAVE